MSEDAFHQLRDDPALGPTVTAHGPIELEPADDVFERLIRSIVSQQVSTDAATAIRNRLYDSVDITPAAILDAEESTLQDAGLSRQKVAYVQNVAEAFMTNDYSRADFAALSDDEIVAELTDITGVGVWTAKMQLIFSFARPDVFPVEDLGIRHAMTALFGDEVDRAGMRDVAERWRPYRSYATLYLWRTVD